MPKKLSCPKCGSWEVATFAPTTPPGAIPYLVAQCIPCGNWFSRPAESEQVRQADEPYEPPR